jgi:prepilin-type processing-associated H-X9-DG protein
MTKSYKSKKLTRVEVLVVVLVCVFVLAVLRPGCRKLRFYAFRSICAQNLSKIGKAMLVYADDYDGKLPRAGGRNTVWGRPVAWNAASRFGAYSLNPDGTGGRATISSSLYLLVKYADAAPESFVCPADSGTIVFAVSGIELTDAWDFGFDSYNSCSYSYHMPYCLYPLTTSCNPGMAVAADRNPWIGSPSGEAKDMTRFKPDGGREAVEAGNAVTHHEEGQNVLFLDGHVRFAEDPFCGVNGDNIYTVWDGGDVRRGGTPTPGAGVPQGETDSVLVHDWTVYVSRVTTTIQPEAVDSANLEQTRVVATLDCPAPEHRNVIWCSTFQMAWDRLKDDIIGEPIIVPGAEELASRLNQAKVSPDDLEEESFYATAGFVRDGILEEIQKQMAERFPSEPVPVFDERYRTLPDAIAAYSYLSVAVEFQYPFYTNNAAFTFTDSSGTRTNVTSFCTHTEGPDRNLEQVREQVEIVYYKYGDDRAADEFAVDLCKHTQPYQVVLARVARRSTLRETAAQVQQKISEFKNDPDYKVLRKLRPIDSLIVPDVLYKLTHDFSELLYKPLANPQWRDYFLFEAMQMIDFTLSRTGVILKSEARLGGGSAAPPRIQEPRHLHFDRPFLIYVKKRGADTSAFFVMWVDNAELMKKFEAS